MEKNTRGDLVAIIDILKNIERLFDLAKDYDNFMEFYNAAGHMPFNSSIDLLVDIGAASKRISNYTKEEHTEIPWHVMKCFIDVTEKDCPLLNREILFDLIKDKLPRMCAILENILLKELENKEFDIDQYKGQKVSVNNRYKDFEDSLHD